MRKSAELRKAEIVDEVLRLADRIGPDRVTSGAVASAVGVTQAAVFRHFPSMTLLWHAVAEHVSRAMVSAWSDALTTASGPLERIEALVSVQLLQIRTTPALPMLLFSRELNVANADLREAFRGRLQAFQSLLIAELRKGQSAGLLRNDLQAEDAAVLLTSLVQGMAIRWSLWARNFALLEEGQRLLAIQMWLLTANSQEKR